MTYTRDFGSTFFSLMEKEFTFEPSNGLGACITNVVNVANNSKFVGDIVYELVSNRSMVFSITVETNPISRTYTTVYAYIRIRHNSWEIEILETDHTKFSEEAFQVYLDITKDHEVLF